MPRSYRRNPTENDICRDIVEGQFFMPDLLAKLAQRMRSEATRLDNDGVQDQDQIDALFNDADVLDKIVKRYENDFAE